MTNPTRIAALTATATALALTGCGVPNPYAPTTTTAPLTSAPARGAGVRASSPQNPGELPAPPPPSSASQAPTDVQATPMLALRQFAGLYINWSYHTLARDQQTLAALAVGPARLAEQQAAAATTTDSTITRGQVFNAGELVSVSPALTTPGQWVLVTHERTGGNTTYNGLQAAYHVTLATLAPVPGGYAVTQWQPQN